MKTVEEMLADVNQHMMDVHGYSLFPITRQPNYRYFPIGKDEYFWTTEPLKHKGKKRFASGVYRYLKTKKQWKLTNERYHVRRRDAKARAYKMYREAKGGMTTNKGKTAEGTTEPCQLNGPLNQH